MIKPHATLLDQIEAALDRDGTGVEPMPSAEAGHYLEKLQVVMVGEIGNREWRLHEALKAKAAK